MTENKKLRELLAEARNVFVEHEHRLVSIWGKSDTPYAEAYGWIATRREDLIKSINTALAEPVVEAVPDLHLRIRADYDKSIAEAWHAEVTFLERERDEARAEIERLKSFAEGPTWDTHRESVAAGYQRGVAAMRKAVSDYLDKHGWFLSGQAKASIRAIPDPKDK